MDFPATANPGFATIKVRNTATIPQTLIEFGADPAAIFRAVGLDPDLFSNPENVYSYAALGRLAAESVRVTRREDFGLRVGSKLGVQAVELAGLVSLHAPTVGEALQVVIEGLRTTDTGGAVYLETKAERAACGYIVRASNVEAADQIIDGAIAVLFNTMRALCGPGWRPLGVRLARTAPPDRAPFAKFFEAPIEYSALAAALIFPAATLHAPARDHKPEYAQILAPLLKEALAKASDDFVTSVRSVIRSQVGDGPVTRDRVTRALGLNVRTFARRLETHGLTFSTLADEARYDAARGLLMKDRKMGEIAAMLGFAEQSAFSRAFKIWSGTTPGRWRAERGADRPAG